MIRAGRGKQKISPPVSIILPGNLKLSDLMGGNIFLLLVAIGAAMKQNSPNGSVMDVYGLAKTVPAAPC